MVKLRLCPFAEAVFNTNSGVRYIVTPAVTTDEVWKEFLREVDHLMSHDRKVGGCRSFSLEFCFAVTCCKAVALMAGWLNVFSLSPEYAAIFCTFGFS